MDFDLEFRWKNDDAWYSIKAILQGHKLIVQYENFPEISYTAGDFQSLEEVEEFSGRFRPVSSQLQDNECYKAVEGTRVCACASWNDDDLRFYDAIVEVAEYKDHSFENIEEECRCNFVLFWLHGPNAGNLSSSGVANICIVNPAALPNSAVTSFLELAKESVNRRLLQSNSVFKSCKTGQACFAAQSKSIEVAEIQETQHARQFPSTKQRYEVVSYERGEDQDIGGIPLNMNRVDESGNQYLILIDNLEKDLSPTLIMEFIHGQTSVSAEAYVFPSLLAESYARGAIVLDSKRRLEEIYEFLTNPDHIIVSSTGRPWVITEKKIRRGYFRTYVGSLMPISQGENIGNKLRVVHSGTEEYERAAGLKNLFLEFVDHQRGLHQSLSLELDKMLSRPSL